MLLWAWTSHAAFGQDGDIQIIIEPNDVGLGVPSHMRPGCWTPLRVNLISRGQAVRQVVLQWVLRDVDGDYIVSEQPFTLSPTQSVQQQSRWLYAQPPVDTSPTTQWNVYVRDAESRELLAAQTVGPVGIVNLQDNTIGIMGVSSAAIGLLRYQDRDTQHEEIKFLQIDSLENLPDRWYGLSMLEALIWTRAGGDPEAMPRSSQMALREWVQRGGHLVIVHPYVGDPWVRSSLRDLLPAVRMTALSDQPMPEFMGLGDLESMRLDYRVLTPMSDDEAIQQGLRPGSDVSVLLSATGPNGEERPLVVTHRYGFGRVTLIGTDLTDGRVTQTGLPNTNRFWRAVFGWRSPAYDLATIKRQRDENYMPRMAPQERRSDVILVGREIEGLIAMRETAAPGLLLAMLLFIIYWLAAGPVGFAYLRNKRMLRHSWLAFVVVIAVTSVIAWGGAYLLRPQRSMVRHFTVLDGDVSGNTVHAHSWAALFVPAHGTVEVALDPDHEGANTNVLGGAGVLPNMSSGGYPDPRRYLINAGAPASAQLPFRSTSRQLEIDYLGELSGKHRWVADEWVLPRPVDAGLRMVWRPGETSPIPVGSLVHKLPGPLTEVLLVFCPGNGQEPVVHRLIERWKPDELLTLAPTLAWTPLVIDANMMQTRNFNREGYLGQLLAAFSNIRIRQEEEAIAPVVKVLPQDFVRRMEMLSFYSTLPPPDFRRNDLLRPAYNYIRPVGRSLDLSHLIATRQLLVIGHLEGASLPIPLSVDGEMVASEGWTVVRAICPVDSAVQGMASTIASSAGENR